MKIIKQTLLFGSGFAGGLIAGLYITSGNNSETLQTVKQKTEQSFGRAKEATGLALAKSSECLREFNNRIKKEITHPIPDLYRATESFGLEEEDVIPYV